MTVPAPSLDEEARLAALYACEILDTLPESAFDDLVELAQRVCGTPAAAISFIDSDRQWLKAFRGPMAGVPRKYAFCSHTIEGPGTLVVPDATQDARFADNPFVAGEPRIRFYAGVPLVTSEGARVGALCVLDQKPRTLEPAQQAMLEILARQIGAQLVLRRQQAALQEALASHDEAVQRLELVYALQRCVSEARDLPAAMAAVIAQLCHSLDFAAGAIWLVPRNGGSALVNVDGYWLSDPTLSPFRDASLSTTFTVDMGIPGLAWRKASAVWLDKLIDEPGLPRLTPALAAGLASGVAVPVFVDGSVVAIFELFSTRPRASDKDSVALLAHAAADLGALIRRRQHDDELEALQRRLADADASAKS
jgi:GAF domain-containing protein